MSVNKYMHPRNIYKNPPNFKQLAIDYPEFREHVKQDLSGKVLLDFKDLSALRALTCTLLKKDFNLIVEIPLNKLIPTIPLRLNYILWIEDLLEISNLRGNIKGIDIGTGTSCVYPLIASSKNGWSMLATEIDNDSFKYASDNVNRNNLSNLIQVKKVQGSNLIENAVSDEEYDFCMCNPPFFGSQQETIFEFKSRKTARPRPKNAFSAAPGEVVASGGEVGFVTKLINESKVLQQRVRIYTSMIGQKSSLASLKKLLREVDVMSFKQTDFCQGNTTRWGLAWTFCDIDLRKVPASTVAASRKEKNKHPICYTLCEQEGSLEIKDLSTKICDIFNNLQMDFKVLKESKNVIAFNVIAHSNTWSHQRRKRREEIRSKNNPEPSLNNSGSSDDSGMAVEEGKNEVCNPNIDITDLISEMRVKSPGTAKREIDDDGYYNNKRFKLNSGEDVDVSKFFLETTAVLRRDNKGVHFEFIWVDGIAGKDSLQQILQYFKNNLKI